MLARPLGDDRLRWVMPGRHGQPGGQDNLERATGDKQAIVFHSHGSIEVGWVLLLAGTAQVSGLVPRSRSNLLPWPAVVDRSVRRGKTRSEVRDTADGCRETR